MLLLSSLGRSRSRNVSGRRRMRRWHRVTGAPVVGEGAIARGGTVGGGAQDGTRLGRLALRAGRPAEPGGRHARADAAFPCRQCSRRGGGGCSVGGGRRHLGLLLLLHRRVERRRVVPVVLRESRVMGMRRRWVEGRVTYLGRLVRLRLRRRLRRQLRRWVSVVVVGGAIGGSCLVGKLGRDLEGRVDGEGGCRRRRRRRRCRREGGSLDVHILRLPSCRHVHHRRCSHSLSLTISGVSLRTAAHSCRGIHVSDGRIVVADVVDVLVASVAMGGGFLAIAVGWCGLIFS